MPFWVRVVLRAAKLAGIAVGIIAAGIGLGWLCARISWWFLSVPVCAVIMILAIDQIRREDRQ